MESIIRWLGSISSFARGMRWPRWVKKRDPSGLTTITESRQHIIAEESEQRQLLSQSMNNGNIGPEPAKEHGNGIELNDVESGGINATRGVDVVGTSIMV